MTRTYVAPEVTCAAGTSFDPSRGCAGDLDSDGDATLAVRYRHEMSGAFALVHVSCAVDGTQVFDAKSTNMTAPNTPLFDGRLKAGEHQLSILLELRGVGYGVFSYLSGYTFTVKSAHSLVVDASRPARVVVVGLERGQSSTPLEQRPSLRFEDALAAP